MWRTIAILLIACLPYLSYADVTIDNPHTATELINTARELVNTNGDPELILDALTGILLMPPGEYTQEVKRMIGMVHERQGKAEKAKHDYAAYIAEYPDSPDTQSIRLKLIALEIAKPKEVIDAHHPRTPNLGSSSDVSGSLSEYYYASSLGDDIGKWKTDQAALISSISLTGTFKNDEYLTKTVLRYSDSLNLYPYSIETSRIAIAYVSVNDTFRDYGFKVGRQNPLPGVLGRFDGVQFTDRVSNDLDISVQTGVPYMGTTDSRRFYGTNATYMLSPTVSLTGYYNYQEVNAFAERSVFGLQYQYLKNDTTILVNGEYDTLYSAFNSFMLQGFTAVGVYNLYTLVDIRKSPVLFADRALSLGTTSATRMPYLTVSDMLADTRLSNNQLYQYINSTTPTLSTFVIGVDGPLVKQWTWSANFQQTNITPTTDTSFIPATDTPIVIQISGAVSNSVNIRLSGVDIFTKHSTIDVLVGLSVDNISTSDTLTAIYTKTINDSGRVDFLIRHLSRDQNTTSMTIDTESVRMNYRYSPKVSIEMKDRASASSSTASNTTFLVGIRYDF
jgi:hypothetical protein